MFRQHHAKSWNNTAQILESDNICKTGTLQERQKTDLGLYRPNLVFFFNILGLYPIASNGDCKNSCNFILILLNQLKSTKTWQYCQSQCAAFCCSSRDRTQSVTFSHLLRAIATSTCSQVLNRNEFAAHTPSTHIAQLVFKG